MSLNLAGQKYGDLTVLDRAGSDNFGRCKWRCLCSKRHLNRYLAEFDFRQNTRVALGIDDVERTKHAIRGMAGKRLTYLDSSA